VSVIRFLIAAAVCGGYMLAAQDAQPWFVSIGVAVLIGALLMPAEGEREW
jgi:hypothetical protein